MQIFNKTVQTLTQVSGNSRSEPTNNNEKACNNIPETVNKLALSAGLGHSFETGWNKPDHSYIIQKQNQTVITGWNFSFIIYNNMINTK